MKGVGFRFRHIAGGRAEGRCGRVLSIRPHTSRLANALGVELIAAEAARPTEHPDALDYILRGRAAGLKPDSRGSSVERITLFEKALALDPQSVEAQILLANALVGRVLGGMTDSASTDLARAEGLVGEALAASPRSAYAHYVKSRVLRAQKRWEEAVPEYETALVLNRNLVGALNGLGWCKLYAGSLDEVTPLVKQAIRLSPRDPHIGTWYYLIGTVHLLQSRTDEAIVAVLSEDAVTTRPPVASNVAARTGPSCCSFLPIGAPVRASQIRAVLSEDAVTTRSPLASNVAA